MLIPDGGGYSAPGSDEEKECGIKKDNSGSLLTIHHESDNVIALHSQASWPTGGNHWAETRECLCLIN